MFKINLIKKIILICLLVNSVHIIYASNHVNIATSVYVNGEQVILSQPPILINGITMLPLRSIFEKFDAKIIWNKSSINIKNKTSNIHLQVNRKEAFVNDKRYMLETPPILINGVTMVPLRFIVESLGAEVYWDEINKGIYIKKISIESVDKSHVEKWLDDRTHLNIIDYSQGEGFSGGYDIKSIHPTIYNWANKSRFPGMKVNKIDWSLNLKTSITSKTVGVLNIPPVIGSDGTLYLFEGYFLEKSNKGKIFAVHPEGKLLWDYQVGYSNVPPTIGKNGILYVIGNDSIYALYPNGELKLKSSIEGFVVGLSINNENLLYLNTINYDNKKRPYSKVVVLTSDFEKVWEYKINDEIDNDIGSASPIFDKSGNAYLFTENGYLYSISKNGNLNWKLKTSAYEGYISISKSGDIYLACSNLINIEPFYDEKGYISNSVKMPGAIYKINPHGKLDWVIDNIYVSQLTNLSFDSDNNLYIGGSNYIYKFSPNGDIIWQKYMEDLGQARLTLDKNDNLYVTWYSYGDISKLLIYSKDGEFIRSVGIHEEIQTQPVLSHDGSVYFTTKSHIYKLIEK